MSSETALALGYLRLVLICTQGDLKKECQVGLYLHSNILQMSTRGGASAVILLLHMLQILHRAQCVLLLMTLPFTVVVELRIGVHALALAAPVPLSLIDEPVVDLLQVQGANSLQVLLLNLLHTIGVPR